MTGGKRVLIGKRYVDDRFAALEKRLDERAEALAMALEKAEDEYERRLGELNHAHARALDAQSKTVSRETFDLQMEAINRTLRNLLVFWVGTILTVAGWLVFR